MNHLTRFFQRLGVCLVSACLLFAFGQQAFPTQAASLYGLTSPEEVEDFFDSQIETQ